MSARAAGRIAAVVTARRVGAGIVPGGTAELMQFFSADPQHPESSSVEQQEPETTEALPPRHTSSAVAVSARAAASPEGRALNSLISYIPSEAIVIYLVGVAVVAQIHDPVPSASKTTAVWLIFVVAFIANAVLLGLGFRERMREAGADTLDIRQVGPLVAGLVAIELAFFVLALAVPGGILVWDVQWIPVLLLVGGALVLALAKVFCLAPLSQATRDT